MFSLSLNIFLKRDYITVKPNNVYWYIIVIANNVSIIAEYVYIIAKYVYIIAKYVLKTYLRNNCKSQKTLKTYDK